MELQSKILAFSLVLKIILLHPFIKFHKNMIYLYYLFTYQWTLMLFPCTGYCITIMYNNAAVNMAVQISLWDSDFIPFRYTPKSGINVSYGSTILIFWGTSILLSIVAIPICILPPPHKVWVLLFLHIFYSFTFYTIITCLIDISHFNRCEVISHCGFDLHFPDWLIF